MKFKDRYQELMSIVAIEQPRRIIEIGTWNGGNSCKMIKYANSAHGKHVFYYGFDLFEDFTPELAKTEFCPKAPARKASVESTFKVRVDQFCSWKLIQGNTRETIPECKFEMFERKPADLIFIDGGHSVKTIFDDFHNLLKRNMIKSNTTVIFDDWYADDSLTDSVGCNEIVNSLSPQRWKIELGKCVDEPNGGTRLAIVRMVKREAA